MITRILINGEESDGLVPVTDSSVLRGDACFEVLKAYRGRMMRLAPHLDRLERSASALQITLPSREKIAEWLTTIAGEVGDGAVRLVVTRGSSVPGIEGDSRVIVFGHPWSRGGDRVRLYPVSAPWHAAGEPWELAGAKITSYAPNLATTRTAVQHGFDDALLLSIDGFVLEGPTFSVAWVVDGVLETPTLELGILDSITRQVTLELAGVAGLQVVHGRWGLDRLASASEVLAFSTIREIQSVAAIGELVWERGPITNMLQDGYIEEVS